MNIKDLIGKNFPIYGFENDIVGTREIKKVAEVENYAGILISAGKHTELHPGEPEHYILIKYTEAEDYLNGKYDHLPRFT